MNKVIRIGDSVFCKISYAEGKLSISGAERPTRDGDARSCGQILDVAASVKNLAPEWTQATQQQFVQVWGKYHLNNMQAGTPAQTAYLESLGKYESYDWACAKLEEANLLNDPAQDNYRYGTAWLRIDVPQEALDFLASLPDTDREPAWV